MPVVLLIACLHGLLLLTVLANVIYLERRRQRVSPDVPPRVSVLIPARNEEENLQRLLPSLLAQDYPDFEVIVYDDGSDDGTWNVLQRTLQQDAGGRLQALRGNGPPPGWVGKVHALYQATRSAGGDLYLFLDADAELADRGALGRLVERFAALPPDSILTGLTRLTGGGQLLVSLVPNTILLGLPWPLVRRLPLPGLGALNGQCWMLPAATYHKYEPHEHLPNEILEDVQIGRYLKSRGLAPELIDVQGEVIIHMYRDFQDAWQGFRKNAYLLMGGTPIRFVLFFVYYALAVVIAPFIDVWFLASIYVLKRLSDRLAGFPFTISLLAPVSFALGSMLQLHSAVSHWTGQVRWKGRTVGVTKDE